MGAYPDLDSHNAVIEDDVVSLAGMSLVRSGWCKPSREILSAPCLVIRPTGVAFGH